MAGVFKNYYALLRMLKTKFPAGFPVHVRRVKLSKKLDGRCWKHGKKFFIQIDNQIDEIRAMDTLLHEWAHARAWNHRLDTAETDEVFNKLAHDAAWGVAFAELYSAYEMQFTHAVL